MNLKDKEQSLKLAEHYFRDNNYPFAQHILENVIKIDPNNSKGNELLSYIYANLGQFDLSFKMLEVACKQSNCSPEALYYLGTFQLKRCFYHQAIESFKKSISKGGEFYEALHELATVYAKMGDANLALFYYQKCLQFGTISFELFYNIARSFDELKRLDEAIAHYDKALSLKPDYAEAWSNKGNTLYELKRLDEAIAHYDKALSLKPDYAEAWSNKGITLTKLKRHDEAIAHYDKALSLKPDYAEAWFNKGIALDELKRFDEAIAHYDKALSLKPDYAEAWFNKGIALDELKRFDEAIAHYDKALSLKSDINWAHGNLLHIHMKICVWLDLADSLDELSKKVMSNERASLPFPVLALNDDASLHKKSSEIYSQHKYPKNLALGPIHKNSPQEKIRIGYFSPDFRNHAVSFLMAELFELHDKNRFEIVAFSFGADDKSFMRSRLSQAFNQFIDVSNISDLEIAKLARDLHVDIAVDLGGYTANARTGIFSYQAAPIQAGYIGYLGTMGAEYIDYLFADKTILPEEFQKFYSEKIAYLPSYQANDRKRVISDRFFTRQELGLPPKGFVFCCFNNSYKILPDTFSSWMRILQAVDGSVLFLYGENIWAEVNLRKEAEVRGIDKTRLIFGGHLPQDEYLARYRACDLFLDTFPYNAGTTASDALWAGLPVLTLMGESFASRVAASLLNAINLPELITNAPEEYEALAIELAMHPRKLANIKLKLANNRLTTPLFDTPLFTKNLEVAYIKMYERYQNDLQPDHISIV